MNLIKAVLEHVEEHGNGKALPVLKVDGHNAKEIEYHLQLCEEAGYVASQSAIDSVYYRLTWAGHEALEQLRRAEGKVFT